MSGAANGQPVPFNLDAAAAAIEQASAPFVFEYKGRVYQMRNPALVRLAIQEDLAKAVKDEDEERQAELMAEMIGKETYRGLLDAGATGATLQALTKAAAEAGGVPNSSAPSRRASATRR